ARAGTGVPDHRLSGNVRHRPRRHDPPQVDRTGRLDVAGQSRARRAAARARAAGRRRLAVARMPGAQRDQGADRYWRERAVALLTNRFGLKAVSVFLAILLLFVVHAQEPPVELVPVRLVPPLDRALVLR